MRWASIICLAVFGILLLVLQFRSGAEGVTKTPSARVDIGGVTVQVALADTPAARTQGLSGSTALMPGEGMLFVFPDEERHAFWMKDMRFPIDIIWLSRGGEVVHLEKSVTPESYPASFAPPQPALFVLEVPSGFSDTYGIKIGDRATLPENLSQ